MAVSDKHRLYGLLVLNFANADTTDKAGHGYFKNIQTAFGFPEQFADKAKTQFPSKNDFYSSLKKTEIQCFKLILEKSLIETGILCAMDVEFLKYDIYSKSFHIRKILTASQSEDNFFEKYYSNETTDQELSGAEIERIAQSGYIVPGYESIQESVSSSILKLLDIGEKILALKEITEVRFKQLSDLEPYYIELTLEHNHIKTIQNNLNIVLNHIITTKLVPNNLIFKKFLLSFNKIKKFRAVISTDGHIEKTSPFCELRFLNRNENFHFYSENMYDAPIAFGLIELLQEAGNIEYLKKCALCNKYYIALKKYSGQKYCAPCSVKNKMSAMERNDYMKIYRNSVGRKRLLARRKHEKKIEHLMVNAGKTREEAENILREEDVN